MKTQYIEGNDFVDDVLPIAVYLSITSIFTNINISFFGGSLDVSVRLKVVFNTKTFISFIYSTLSLIMSYWGTLFLLFRLNA